jgi:hypothetical protein
MRPLGKKQWENKNNTSRRKGIGNNMKECNRLKEIIGEK